MIHYISHELYISWRFTFRDMTTTMLPAFIFGITAVKHAWPIDTSKLILLAIQNLFYFWLYIYQFCLANQIAGIEEDRLNKPDRPLPSGMVTMEGARLRWILSTSTFFISGYLFNVLGYTIIWIVVTLLLAFGHFDRHWFTKNPVSMTLGTVAQLGATWEMITPMTPVAWHWIVIVALFGGMPTCIQDFRDVIGDRLLNRQTLPLAIGNLPARIVMSLIFFLGVPFLLHIGLLSPLQSSLGWCFDVMFVSLSILIALRLICYQTIQADHTTYMIFTYQYCLILLSSIFLL